ncbi:MAG TPA: BMC domain-containing protein [Myxococcaceae bacterium]|nr:BMC domain-containing protein [Myxococcaceae bacterium]
MSKRVRSAAARVERKSARPTGPGPALGLLEIESIARGMIVADALVKRAPVSLMRAEATTPGKYLLLFGGGVAEVDESMGAGRTAAGTTLIDSLFLPAAADGLWDALAERYPEDWGESVGIVETHSVAAALLAADTALKRAEVWLKRLHLARGIGGKGYFTLTGDLHMTQAALEAAGAALQPHLLLSTELIEQPHSELKGPVL